MKIIFLLFIALLFACSKEKTTQTELQKFIDVDNNADYRNYFENLSIEYIETLKDKYKSSNLEIVYDSLVKDRKEINDSINAGRYIVTNYVIDSFLTTNNNVKIIKYRNSVFDAKFNSELFKEKILLQKTYNGEKKYIPYNPKLTPNIDSVLINNISTDILNEIKESLIFKEYESTDGTFIKVEKRFKDYIYKFRKDDVKILDFIYPPIYQALLDNNDLTEFTQEQKLQITEYLKLGRKSQELNFKNFLIDKFYKINCVYDKPAYLLHYAIDVENNLYIHGKLIAILEGEEIYFVEVDIEEFKTNYRKVFDESFITCLEVLINDK